LSQISALRLLILLIGVPGSGKSSLAQQLQQTGYSLVSTDQIRAALFGRESVQGDWSLIGQAVEQKLRAAFPCPTVYDATNSRRSARRAVIRLARQIGYDQIVGLWLNPPLTLCLDRNQQRLRQVPEPVIRRMYQQLRSSPPRLSEGLDLLLHYGSALDLGSAKDSLSRKILLSLQAKKPEAKNLGQSTAIAPIAQQKPNRTER
jgi:predicted kinase